MINGQICYQRKRYPLTDLHCTNWNLPEEHTFVLLMLYVFEFILVTTVNMIISNSWLQIIKQKIHLYEILYLSVALMPVYLNITAGSKI